MGRRESPLPRGASGRRTRRGEAAGRRVSVEPELGGSKGDGAARVLRGGGGTDSRGFGEGCGAYIGAGTEPWRAGQEGRSDEGRTATGLCESPLVAGKRTGPTGGTRLSATQEGKARMGRRARETGPGEGGWAACGKRKRSGLGRARGVGRCVEVLGRGRETGRTKLLGRKRCFLFIFFCKRTRQIQFEFKLNEFKFKLNNKQ